MGAAIMSFHDLSSAVKGFRESLYHQKHAFYFRKVQTLEGLLKVSIKLSISVYTSL